MAPPNAPPQIIARLKAVLGDGGQETEKPGPGKTVEQEVEFEEPESESDTSPQASSRTQSSDTAFHRIDFKPSPDLLKSGNEPLLILRELSGLGNLDVGVDASALPRLADMEPETSYLQWSLRLETDQPESEIRKVFEFVDSQISFK